VGIAFDSGGGSRSAAIDSAWRHHRDVDVIFCISLLCNFPHPGHPPLSSTPQRPPRHHLPWHHPWHILVTSFFLPCDVTLCDVIPIVQWCHPLPSPQTLPPASRVPPVPPFGIELEPAYILYAYIFFFIKYIHKNTFLL